MQELPVIQEEVPLRADAARNRDKVLAAAERLFREHGPDCVSMDAVAAEAGVGKGTLFRGFGDRAGLVLALLTEQERRLQEDVIRGPAPLGPGAPPRRAPDRLRRAAVRALRPARRADRRGREGRHPLPLGAVRLLPPPRADARRRKPRRSEDWEYIADALLAAMRVDHILYLQTVREMSDERIAAGWADLVRRLCG